MSKKTLFKAIAVFAALLALSACGKNPVENQPDENNSQPGGNGEITLAEPDYPESIGFEDYEARRAIRESYPIDESFTEAMNEFSYKTAAKLLSGSGNANYSPTSLYYALSVAATGANGKTAAEILSLLGAETPEKLSQQCENYYRNAYFDNSIGSLKIANSVWVQNGKTLKEDFYKNAAEKFFASVYNVDFSTKEGMKQISDWISENTKGVLAPEKEPDPEQLFSIINTVYFYDEWTDCFSKANTKADDFNLLDGKTVSCDFMNRGSSGTFRKGEGWTAATLGLKNSDGMTFILPDEGVSVAEILSDERRLKEALEGGEEVYGEIVWKVPKFSFGSSFDLKESLEALGIESAFSALNADFSNMTAEEIYLSQAVQQTHIGIDENGVEAAAYTELGYAGAGMPEDRAEMILDRPFIYGIKVAGSWLFVGVCADPIV